MSKDDYPEAQWVKEVCKIGQGPLCCRYLTMMAGGWSCEKLGPSAAYLDKRVAEGTFTARGDNCEGKRSR